MDLKFIPCPYCQKPFQDGDDIVVCPECGTPAHRSCYKALGHCLHEEKHGTGFAWEAPYSKEREEAEQKAREEEAARRQARTFGDGADGAQRDTRPDGMPFDNEYGNYASYTTGDHGEMRPTMRVIGPDEMMGDFRVREYGDVIQKNKNRYIPKFFMMDRTKRNFVGNFAAFLVPTLWSAYRRMYGLAIILVILQFIVPLFALDSVVEYFSETYSLAREYALTEAMDPEAAQEAAAKMMEKLPQQPLVLQINHYVVMAIHLLMGMFANTIYKRRCEQLLTKAKTIENQEERAEFVRRRGGTSIIAAVLVAAIFYTLLNLIVSFGMQKGYGQEVAEATTKAAEAATEAAKQAKEALIALWRK